MKGRTLALFLLVYLSLDLANPFMPGVVTFADGRLEVIDAGRPSGADLPIRDIVGEAAPRGEPTFARPSSRPAAAGEHLRRWWIPPRRAFSIAPEPGPSSDEH
jgi:hypothetical protein